MVTYRYSVTDDGPTYSIQEAINKIAVELSTYPSLVEDIIVNVGDGAYAGFVIPNGAFSALGGSVYRVVVQSAGDFLPIVDFNLNSSLNVGIDIGSNNPNVSIDGLRVQFFPVGIRASINSHYPIIKNCVATNNRNAGVLVEQCRETQIIQNIVINGDYGIVVRRCKSSAIVHNTVFQNGAIATEKGKSQAGIFASLANDYGGGLSDTGILHLIGNLVWNITGRCISLFQDDVERTGAIVSNYNDYVLGDSSDYIALLDRRFYTGVIPSVRRVISNLLDWKALGFDLDSINADPKFISPVRVRQDRNGYALDLNLLTVSPVLGLVPSFFVNATATAEWLPTYLDTETISKDILGKPRVQSGTAAGANDTATNVGFYGQDIFTNPLDLNITKNCELDPVNDVISNKLDIWFPRLNIGYFYSNEREFYLYANKKCLTLSDIAVTKFRLPSKMANNLSYSVTVNGIVISQDYLDVIGDELFVYHQGAPINHYNEEVDIQYYVSAWKNGGFSYQETNVIFKIKDGITKFYLPDDYVAKGPVVVTDDQSFFTDSDYMSNREFTLKFDEYEQKTELIFANNSNQFLNSQFDYSIDGAPTMWESQLATVISRSEEDSWEWQPVAGSNVCSIQNGGYIGQLVKFNDPSTLSFHVMSTGSSVLSYSLHAYDHINNDLGYVGTGTIIPGREWSRKCIVLGPTGIDDVSYRVNVPYSGELIDTIYIPDQTYTLDIKLVNMTGDDVFVDAVHYKDGTSIDLYHRKPYLNEITVEYESLDEDYYTDAHQSMSPVRSYTSDGFLYIPEIPASVYNGPSDLTITTLHEWKWFDGRKNVLPWARTKGKDKLAYRPNGIFNTIPQLKPEIIVPALKSDSIKDIDVSPSEVICVQGDQNGVGLSISVIDQAGNPMSLCKAIVAISDPYKNYPGVLFKKAFGLKEQLVQTVVTNLDSAGILNLIWLPPDNVDSALLESIPKPLSVAGVFSRLCYFKTKYPVSLTNHGNITIYDAQGNLISTKGSEYISGTYTCTINKDLSKVKVEYPIVYSSVKVTSSGVQLVETFSSVLESDQFYVDYENSIIQVKGSVTDLQIEYLPHYVYVTQIDPYKIIVYYDDVFSEYSVGDKVHIDYDYSIPLNVSILDPTLNTYITKTFELVAQNSMLSDNSNVNTLSMEI